jgi:ABC-type multidrug transport system fused ATPase/permease subunit
MDFGLAQNGVALSDMVHTADRIPAEYMEVVTGLRDQIIAGDIVVWDVSTQGYPKASTTDPRDGSGRGSRARTLHAPMTAPAPTIALGAVDLHKSYGEVRANRGISIAVAAGAIHAVVGENGAGKSTLMRMLQGVEVPDHGHVVIDDAPVRLTGPARRAGAGHRHGAPGIHDGP